MPWIVGRDAETYIPNVQDVGWNVPEESCFSNEIDALKYAIEQTCKIRASANNAIYEMTKRKTALIQTLLAVGVRVRVTGEVHTGATGTIIEHDPQSTAGQWLVEFDNRRDDMREFEGKFWCWDFELELA